MGHNLKGKVQYVQDETGRRKAAFWGYSNSMPTKKHRHLFKLTRPPSNFRENVLDLGSREFTLRCNTDKSKHRHGMLGNQREPGWSRGRADMPATPIATSTPNNLDNSLR